ncbi:flagellar hook-length control protein FliK [Thioalkalivibrio halophilus]|uniref:Flagellar hook-length control protein FliK n=1 Tax=Thioalkalivibrio halophilus TaxID=252474 RepID=A0A1V3A1Y2_9GAMM|nr:flagellar hook-length control protein FliK [Thioalkalivibrio halophilus]OOC11345.1 flagellar hook-length control protein FliK [Thioalkalivibrio halophilus]
MIAAQASGQGLGALAQLLDGGEGMDRLKELKDKGKGGEDGFLKALRPQLEAMLGALGVDDSELAELDLEGLIQRFQDLLQGQDLTAVDGMQLPPGWLTGEEGDGEIDGRELRSLLEDGPESGAAGDGIPVSLMRLFLQAGPEGQNPGSRLQELAPGALTGGGSREGTTEVLAQWLTQASESARSGRENAQALAQPAAQASDAEGARGGGMRLDLTRLLQTSGDRQLAEQIQMMAQARGGRTEMKLHPPQLGVLDVRVSMEGDRASVQFFSTNPVTREVLEAAMPRLRDSLADSGLELADASVSDEPPEDSADTEMAGDGYGGGDEPGVATGADGEGSDEEEGPVAPGSTLSFLNRRVDLFA